jgi:hypothetical protein
MRRPNYSFIRGKHDTYLNAITHALNPDPAVPLHNSVCIAIVCKVQDRRDDSGLVPATGEMTFGRVAIAMHMSAAGAIAIEDMTAAGGGEFDHQSSQYAYDHQPIVLRPVRVERYYSRISMHPNQAFSGPSLT